MVPHPTDLGASLLSRAETCTNQLRRQDPSQYACRRSTSDHDTDKLGEVSQPAEEGCGASDNAGGSNKAGSDRRRVDCPASDVSSDQSAAEVDKDLASWSPHCLRAYVCTYCTEYSSVGLFQAQCRCSARPTNSVSTPIYDVLRTL